MTVKECYDAMGADYDDVMARLRKDDRVQKFLLKVLDDKSYTLLIDSVEERNIPEAFRAAHTLKGVCQNLSLTKLYKSASVLSDVLRDREDYREDIEPALAQVKQDYDEMIGYIRELAG
ncbi:MAG: Hpt domain-containing protein [Coprococcus sp.]|nr:Hpt domain-containing protein [Coprococcus sp.]